MKSVCEMKKYDHNGLPVYNCTNCNQNFGHIKNFDQQPFKFCPGCGKEITNK